MAQIKGILSNLNGSLGDVTFKRIQGRTVASQKMTSYTDRRSDAQMRRRTRWANLVAMYRTIIPLLRGAFENKKAGVSDFNMFMRSNLGNDITPVHLTREMAQMGAAVAAPYVLTQGRLKSIAVSGTGANAVTDILLGNFAIGATTKVKDFAQAVVDNNADWNYNDEIGFYKFTQEWDPVRNIPVVSANAYRVVLDKASEVLLLSSVPAEGFTVVDNCLGHGNASGDYAYAWVHSRKDDKGNVSVSSQSLIANNSKLAQYTTEEAYQKAAESYGGVNATFLDPGSTSVSVSPTPTPEPEPGTQKSVTLSVTPVGGGTVTGAGSYDAGSQVAISATPAQGYTFVKWSDNDTNASRTITLSDDVTLTAEFEQQGGNKYTLVATVEHATVTYSPQQPAGGYDAGTSVQVAVAPAEGWEFDLWSDGDRSNPRTFAMTQDITISGTCVEPY